MKVHFTDAALVHLDGIFAYVSRDSEHYARRVIDRILEKIQSAATMPRAASIVPEYGREDVREVFRYNYRIIYRILPNQIDVLAVVHDAKQLPTRFDELG